MINRKFFVAALALFALASVGSYKAGAQSCPDPETFGSRQILAVNKGLQSQLEVTYFTTDDPNVFISEKAGFNRSASYVSLNANQFVARLEALERSGLASVRKRQSASPFLGEMAQLNLERNSFNSNSGMIMTGHASRNAYDASGLDRRTEINVYEGRSFEKGYYRVSLLSWFVDAGSARGKEVVDYDAIVLLKPGQTAVFKLGSSYEVKRSGAARSYVAVTMRSVNNVGLAQLSHRR